MNVKTKILIVDDNKFFCNNLKDILELKGYEVVCVYNGHKALKAIKEDGFKITLMDVKMPGMSGIDTLKIIKQIAPELTVILLTAFAEDIFYRNGLKSGDFEIITKPFDIDKFLARLEEVIKKRPAS